MKPGVCFLAILFLSCQPLFSASFKEIYLYWANEIGDGLATISEPIALYGMPNNRTETMSFVKAWRSKKEPTFKSIVVSLPFNFPEVEIEPLFDTKAVSHETLGKVFTARQAIFNDVSSLFHWVNDKPDDWVGEGYYFAYSTNMRIGYLEYFQILTLELLITNKDFRLVGEVTALKQYLQEPPWECKLGAARRQYNNTLEFHLLIDHYLALCQKSN